MADRTEGLGFTLCFVLSVKHTPALWKIARFAAIISNYNKLK